MVDASDSKSDGAIHKGSSPFLGTIYLYNNFKGENMLSLELTKEELEEIKYNSDIIKNLLVSRAIYNESCNHEFTESEIEEIKYIEKNEAVKLYIRKAVEPRIVINENEIIDQYNLEKSFFESKNIQFAKAREIIKERLTNELNYGLEQDLIHNIVNNMEGSVTLSKKDILFSKGDPNIIKSILIQNLLNQEAIKKTFFEENKEELKTINKEIRLKYYVNILCSKDVIISDKEVSKYYVDNTKEFEGVDMQSAYSQISNYLYQLKVNENTSKFIESVIKKYNLDKEIEKYKKNNGAVIN